MHVGIGNRETLQEIIMRAAKDAELISPISILSIIYNRMDADFQQHLPKIEKVRTTVMAPTSKQAYIQRMGRNDIRRKVTRAMTMKVSKTRILTNYWGLYNGSLQAMISRPVGTRAVWCLQLKEIL